MMVRQKLKKAWEAVPPGIKRAFGFAVGVAGLLLGPTAYNGKKLSDSHDAFFNHGTGKYDDGHDLSGIYYDDFPDDDHRHYDG